MYGNCFAAGLAAQGYRPFATIYSTFLQRAYDQVVHDVAIQNLPVRFAMDRAGLVGADGSTHAGSFDIAYLATLANFVIMEPAEGIPLEIGKGRIVREGTGIAILNFGTRMKEVLLASERMAGYGLSPTIA